MASPEQIAELLGGPRVLSMQVRTELDLADAVERGLPVLSIDHILGQHHLSLEEIAALIAPKRTLHRRRQGNQRLDFQESNNLERVARVVTRAIEVFGDVEKAHRWLRKPNRVLENKTPLSLLRSDAGARTVETALGRIEHGLFS